MIALAPRRRWYLKQCESAEYSIRCTGRRVLEVTSFPRSGIHNIAQDAARFLAIILHSPVSLLTFGPHRE